AYNTGGPDVGYIIPADRRWKTEIAHESERVLFLDGYISSSGRLQIPVAELGEGYGIPVLFHKGNPYIPLVEDPTEDTGARIYLRFTFEYEDQLSIYSVNEYRPSEDLQRGRDMTHYRFRLAMAYVEEEGTGYTFMPIEEIDDSPVIPLVMRTYRPPVCPKDQPIFERSLLESIEGCALVDMEWEAPGWGNAQS
ncbi:MAG: hypothetical protein KAT70_00140, partial [Thermoplasmata archaeon]|nr:hypothetical protein [Thermoplasmata archaeon]